MATEQDKARIETMYKISTVLGGRLTGSSLADDFHAIQEAVDALGSKMLKQANLEFEDLDLEKCMQVPTQAELVDLLGFDE